MSSFTSDNENNQNENNERQGENLNISKRKKGGFQKKSQVWDWFKSEGKVVICQIEVITG